MFSATWPEDVRRLAQGNQLNKITLIPDWVVIVPAWIYTVSVISSDLSRKEDGNIRFITVPLKALSNQV